MLRPPEGGGVREPAQPIPLQGAALHLQEALPPVPLQAEVHPGGAVGELGTDGGDPGEAAPVQPLPHHLIGGLAVDVHPAQAGLLHRDQVPGGLPALPLPRRQDDPGPRAQQLPAAAGVFHVYRLPPSGQLHLGHEAVRPGQENGLGGVGIDHGLLLRKIPAARAGRRYPCFICQPFMAQSSSSILGSSVPISSSVNWQVPTALWPPPLYLSMSLPTSTSELRFSTL